jgi:hypothetical protein
MDIEVRTDRRVQERGDLARFVGYEVLAGLGPCADRVASARVELSVASTAERGRTRLRCQFEVRPRGHAPLAVSRLAATGDAAVRGAVDDMRHVLERMFRRIDGRHEA